MNNNRASAFDHALIGKVLLWGLLAGTDNAAKWQGLQIQLDAMAEPEPKVPSRATDWHRCQCQSCARGCHLRSRC